MPSLVSSAPGVTRTPGQRFRKPLLYPPELRGQMSCCGAASERLRNVDLDASASFVLAGDRKRRRLRAFIIFRHKSLDHLGPRFSSRFEFLVLIENRVRDSELFRWTVSVFESDCESRHRRNGCP